MLFATEIRSRDLYGRIGNQNLGGFLPFQPCTSLLQGGGTHGACNVPALCGHLRRAGKVAPAEKDARPRPGGMHGHGHRHAGVKTIAFVGNRFSDCVLFSIHNETPFIIELHLYNYFIISFLKLYIKIYLSFKYNKIIYT